MPDNDETSVSEITILPDGRIYVFGMSRQVLEVIESFQVDDPRIDRLSQHVKELSDPSSAPRAGTNPCTAGTEGRN